MHAASCCRLVEHTATPITQRDISLVSQYLERIVAGVIYHQCLRDLEKHVAGVIYHQCLRHLVKIMACV